MDMGDLNLNVLKWLFRILLLKLRLVFLFKLRFFKIRFLVTWLKCLISKANVQTNRVWSTKWTYHKERSFASKYFIFWKCCFNLKTFYRELIWCLKDPNVHISTFCKSWSFIWQYFLPASILKQHWGWVEKKRLLIKQVCP